MLEIVNVMTQLEDIDYELNNKKKRLDNEIKLLEKLLKETNNYLTLIVQNLS